MQEKIHGSLSQSEQEAHNISRQLGFVHTIKESFCANKKAIGLLFAHKTGDFCVIFVTERSCYVPISKVMSRIADRCSVYNGIAFRGATENYPI